MAITLTETATRRVRDYLSREGGKALRLGVRKTGCSGWAYEVSVAESILPTDHVFEQGDITVIVDPDSLPFLDGSRVDFVTEGLNRTFQFENPNATDECGCGESFTVQ
jgi:iron-sulfur cluster assembly protein